MKKKQLDDPRVIAGLFKEAMFYSRPLQVEGDGFSEGALITDFHETSGRAKDSSRTLFLTFTADETDSDRKGAKCDVKLQCHFIHFSGSCQVTLHRCEDGQYRAEMPDTLEVFNRRVQKRTTPSSTETIFLPLVIQHAGFHSEGLFTLENTSQTGFGGVLKVMSKLPIGIGAQVHGKWVTPKGSLSISGRIVRIELLDKGKANTESQYRIGIQQELSIPISIVMAANDRPNYTDRRFSKRVNPELNIQVRSPMNPSHSIEMKVHDASVSGFSARLLDIADSQLLPVSIGVVFQDKSLIAELVGISDSLFRFQFTHGSNADRLFWLKKLANFQNSGTFTSSAVGSELMELFCESGASAAGFLRMQSPFAKAFDDGLASKINEGEWMHRWIERNESGEVRGHMSAIQIADNLWHMGDLAGMIPSERKLTAEFFPKFISSFKEFCLSSSPCPKILLGYNIGHPIWSEFDKYLRQQANDDETIIIQTKYHRFNAENESTAVVPNQWTLTPIGAIEHALISNILNRSEFKEISSLLENFDFSIDTFASPRLSKSIYSSGHVLRRQYSIIEGKTAKYIFVIQSFPLGSSQNRTTDVGWLIPTGLHYLNASDRSSLENLIKAHVRAQGFTSPGYVQILCENEKDESIATKNMTWAIYHPKHLSFFGDRE